MIIAIDGPAGTGKSSVTKRLSIKLGFQHIDTGALYRVLALRTSRRLQANLDDVNASELSKVAIEEALKNGIRFEHRPKLNPSQRVFSFDEDVTRLLRTPEMGMWASRVSAIPEVRAALLDLQRNLGRSRSSILEGRDIGTVIFPDAELKFFLTASLDERAKRRLSELEASGMDVPDFEILKGQIAERDHADSTRAVAPLKPAKDAIRVDTSKMSLDEVVSFMEKIIQKAVTDVSER